ncbi:MAG: electron transfer flavoprotein-ubiquinone oxidoreductase [Rhodobacteraceae bacterium]|nr:electron transfer flavoprotein-ubiquinone oxidoreductase [Paracoccaceae bacterium]
MEYDVVIVGGGPAGLSAAIKLKQLAGDDLSVCVLEKGSEIGAHILSGAVMDPIGMERLFGADWESLGAPLNTPVTQDRFYVLGSSGELRLPNMMMPPLMSNHGAYIVSLGNVCRWLGEQAEALGVEIFPGFAASEPVYGPNGELKGVIAGVMGLQRDGTPGPNYEPGMELHGKYVLIAEGVRGSLAKTLIKNYGLDADSDAPKFGLGMKELWEVKPENHKLGQVTHTMGWPLGGQAGGGSFMYHLENNQVALGFVVHLNYRNPHLFPYMEFQRFKHHPMIAEVLEGGKRISYGARAISEGGWQSIPKMSFPGGLLIGCSAGLVNVPRIKGSHNAMLSGILAAEHVAEAVGAGRSGDELAGFWGDFQESDIARDLKKVRNVKPLWSRFGLSGGLALGGLDMWWANMFGGTLFGTLAHGKNDAVATDPAAKHKPIDYPKPDGVLSFDRLTNVSYSFTNHAEDQPVHLQLVDSSVPIAVNLPNFAEPAQRYCPAGVYEVVSGENGAAPQFVINAQNCVHCKTCDIKDPSQNINWATPQGGEGPNYPNM